MRTRCWIKRAARRSTDRLSTVDSAVPWGMSESGYNVTDAHLNYQYRAFGVPGLGFKRGLAEDLVVAPYASLLALMVAPHEACANLRQMAGEGFLGPYGFYEAIDYTPARPRRSILCGGAVVHGPSSGDEPAGTRLPPVGSADATAIRSQPDDSGQRSAAARADSQGGAVLSAFGRGGQLRPDCQRPRIDECASSPVRRRRRRKSICSRTGDTT